MVPDIPASGSELVKRGDLVTVALPGYYGKPRPALVVQSDAFSGMESVIVAPLTSTVGRLPLVRVLIAPHEENGLRKPSDVMVDKLNTLPVSKVGARFGFVDQATIDSVSDAIRGFLDL